MRSRARLDVSPTSEASSKRQGDGQRFQKKAMKTTNPRIEASAPANVQPSSVSKSTANEPTLSTGTVSESVSKGSDRLQKILTGYPK